MRTPLVVLLGVAMAIGCRSARFDPASKVETVRILATRADEPYAKPGDTVNLEMLAYDGRPTKPSPMNVYWIPVPCVDPPSDSYYRCYPGFASLPAGVDIESMLTAGTTFSFTMPGDVITKHTQRQGAVDADPYGLTVIFSIACAGHVRYLPPVSGGGPNALPLGCFDDNHVALGSDDYEFAFSLVYAFTDRTNANPVVDHLTADAAPIDVTQGLTLAHCAAAARDPNGNVNTSQCPATALDVTMPDSSQEVDPANVDPSGKVLKESIRVQYFLTDGALANGTINLFDPASERIPNTTDDLTAPAAAGENVLWAVVRDNRGGTTWLAIPMHVN